MTSVKLVAVVLLTLVVTFTRAQEHQHGNGEKLGAVRFATSCTQVAQTEFNRAVALLHSFQFSRAIEGFNTVLGQDATCAVAYWGIALSDWSNPFAAGIKDKGQLKLGRASVERGKTVGAKTEREQAYLAAVGKLYSDFESTPQRTRLIAYRDAMRDLAANYPEDQEAQIFYALALAASEDPADKTYADRLKAGGILEKLFEEEPTHPGLAHYIIHTYDVPALAGRGLVAARRYSEIAPDAPHALHMPSHTFTRTGSWQESIDSNIAATAAARREGQTAEELHASDYEIYAYLQTGRDEAARAALAAGKKEEALRQMKSAAELEDGTEKSAVTPGPLAPARELLGEMLLQMNEPAQALEQFEATLQKEPGRFRSLYGAAHAAQLSGCREVSQRYFRELLKTCVRADKPGRSEVLQAERAIVRN